MPRKISRQNKHVQFLTHIFLRNIIPRNIYHILGYIS